jgi:hypothetical protein
VASDGPATGCSSPRRTRSPAKIHTAAADCRYVVSKPLIPAAKNGVAERASRGRGTVCRSVIISVHTCRAVSLTKNLSMSAPRLTGRPRVEALVACGAHQIQTQGKCTREVGGRESGRGRERERAGASVVWRARMHNSPPRRWRRSIMLPALPRE